VTGALVFGAALLVVRVSSSLVRAWMRRGGKSRYGGGADVIHPHGLDPGSSKDFFTLFRELRGHVGSGGTTLISRFSTPPISSTGSEGSAALISPKLGLHHRGRVVLFCRQLRPITSCLG
jgi:hypothetical protein